MAKATTDGFEPDPDNPALMANVEMPVPQAAGWSAL
jgi:hypothetical protein